ncbi:cbf nf-y family transcription factor [Grosmannia clavigera kw1407]|uniref:Cbf nf-y family transcription factor n=1 Tax=Grosmannia clavigera (strain kw1407 / UAMH 11150) TaxID=655863 RepID=F0XHV3_GROCL|nr:cbf nf-y family transcription factor [Grosmannia clavigera kw1407]EFX02947.1 cbf nf-y family transcription factor [Grosmannia clavigera kw1407]
MPYNTTAIPPRKEATGQTQLPLTRVRKIILQDPDVAVCSNNAAFVITLATVSPAQNALPSPALLTRQELFVQYLASEAQNMVKLDRKPRRNVQYKDISNAASRIDRLEFLQDTVPATVPYGKIKADAAAAQAKLRGGAVTAKVAKSDRTFSGTAAAPTTILSLTNGASTETGAGAGAGKRKHQQQLPFTVLNGSNFRPVGGHTATDASVDGSGVAAAAALAQAAAASGTTTASTPLDEAGPNDQLQQDMLRMQDARNHGNGDVEMEDS